MKYFLYFHESHRRIQGNSLYISTNYVNVRYSIQINAVATLMIRDLPVQFLQVYEAEIAHLQGD